MSKTLYAVVGGFDESPDVEVFTSEKKAKLYADFKNSTLDEDVLCGQITWEVNKVRLNSQSYEIRR